MALGQEAELLSMADYIQKHVKTRKTFKNERERKEFLTKTLGLKLQRDPKKNQLCVPVAGKTIMKTGLRMSAARVKNQTFEDDKGGSKEAYARAQESIAASANINTQDRALSLHDGVARVPELGGCQFTHVGTVLSLAACDLSLPDFQPSILLQHVTMFPLGKHMAPCSCKEVFRYGFAGFLLTICEINLRSRCLCQAAL